MIPAEHARVAMPNLWLTPECRLYAQKSGDGWVGFPGNGWRYLLYRADRYRDGCDAKLLLAHDDFSPRVVCELLTNRCLLTGWLFMQSTSNFGLKSLLVFKNPNPRGQWQMDVYSAVKTPAPWVPSASEFVDEDEPVEWVETVPND